NSGGMLVLVLRRLDDGGEIIGEAERGGGSLRGVVRPGSGEVLDFRCGLAGGGADAGAWGRAFCRDGGGGWAGGLAGADRGWDGVRTWESLERDLRIDATHDGQGHVNLRFVVRGPRGYEPDAWEASVVVTVDAGEDMRSLVAELDSLLS